MTSKDWDGPSSRLALRHQPYEAVFVLKVRHPPKKIIKKSQTPKPQGGASGRLWPPPHCPRVRGIQFTKPSMPGTSAMESTPIRPCRGPLCRLWLSGAPSSCLMGCTCRGPQPPGVTSGAHRPPQNKHGVKQPSSPIQEVDKPQSGEKLWGGVPLLPLGTPPAPGPTAALSLGSSVPHAPVTVTHQREACLCCCGNPGPAGYQLLQPPRLMAKASRRPRGSTGRSGPLGTAG